MPLVSVLDGLGLDAAVRRIMRQSVLYYADPEERDRELVAPWPGATTLIGSSMRLEGWSPTEERWVPLTFVGSSGGGPFIIPDNSLVDGNLWVTLDVNTRRLHLTDEVGGNYPALRFGSGDGAAVAGFENDYISEWVYYGSVLRLYHGLNPARPVLSLGRPSAEVAEMTLDDWNLVRGEDLILRFFYGSDRTSAEFAIDTAGKAYASGQYVLAGVHSLWSSGVYFLHQATTNGVVRLQNVNGGGYHDFSHLICRHITQPTGNGWNDRSLVITRLAGAGECAIGFSNSTSGQTASLQLFGGGTPGLHVVNGANSGYVALNASAFTVSSSRRYKRDVVPAVEATGIVEAVQPVTYVDEAAVLAHAVVADPPEPPEVMTDDGVVTRGPVVPRATPEPLGASVLLRHGFVAEDVAEVDPLLVKETAHGPGLDLSGLVAVLWQAVRELSARLAAVEAATAGGST